MIISRTYPNLKKKYDFKINFNETYQKFKSSISKRYNIEIFMIDTWVKKLNTM